MSRLPELSCRIPTAVAPVRFHAAISSSSAPELRRPRRGRHRALEAAGQRAERPIQLGHGRHLHLAAGRAAAHGNVRHEAGRPGGVPRRLPARSAPTSPASTSANICRCTPACADKFTIIRSIAHNFADHGGGHKRFLTGRDPASAGRLRQRLPDGRLDGRARSAANAAAACRTTSRHRRRPRRHRRLQLRLRLPRPVDAPVHGRRRSRPSRTSRCSNLRCRPQPKSRLPATASTCSAGSTHADADRPHRHDGGDGHLPPARPRPADAPTRPARRSTCRRSRASVRDRYGMHRYGQRALLARRLVEAGASFVTMVLENPYVPASRSRPT